MSFFRLSSGSAGRDRVNAAALFAALDKSMGIIEFLPDGRVARANRNFLSVLGYDMEEIRGRHHSIFVAPEYAASPDYAAFWKSLAAGEFREGEFRRFGRDGREIWLQASYNPVLDKAGRVVRVVKVAADVTRRMLDAADKEGQIQAIGRSQAVIEFELDGTIIAANEHFLKTTGYGAGEIRGRHHRIFVDPEEAGSAAYTALWASLRRGEFIQGEFRRICKDGSDAWIQATYNPILDMNGRPFKIVKFAVDVTDQVQARQRAEKSTAIVNDNLGAITATAQSAHSMSRSAAETAGSVNEAAQSVAVGVEQLDSSIQEIARNSSVSSEHLDRAIGQISSADGAVQELDGAAGAMGDIVDLIQDIASRINLLALNATIESARAGEAGKGFAVVANEVKGLANQVAEATGRISGEIDGMQAVTKDVVRQLSAINLSVSEVLSSFTGVAAAIEEQATVTREMSSGVQSVAVSVEQIVGSIDEVDTAIGTADSAARRVRQEIASLVSV